MDNPLLKHANRYYRVPIFGTPYIASIFLVLALYRPYILSVSPISPLYF